jgi:hypothetical protein
MPDLGAFGPALAIGLLVVVMLWFTFGTQRNVRIGNDLLRWLQGGLPTLGPRTTMRWLGSSAVELTIAEGQPPFRDANVVIVLEPRDVGILWALARARGRRDFVILRANLRRVPRFSLQVVDPGSWTRGLAHHEEGDGWSPIEWPGRPSAYASAGADAEIARSAWQRLEVVSGGVWRLTVQPVVPHLEIHVLPPARLDPAGAAALTAAIRDLALDLSR